MELLLARILRNYRLAHWNPEGILPGSVWHSNDQGRSHSSERRTHSARLRVEIQGAKSERRLA